MIGTSHIALIWSLLAIGHASPPVIHDVCTDNCTSAVSYSLGVCNANYLECLSNAAGDPDLQYACDLEVTACQVAAHAAYDLCLVRCSAVAAAPVKWAQVKVLYR